MSPVILSRGGTTGADNTQGGSVQSKTPATPTNNQQPKTKVVVRRLPPHLPQDIWHSTVKKWIDNPEWVDWWTYVPGKLAKTKGKENVFSRAYIHFKSPSALLDFHKSYNGHTFVDSKGTSSRAIVEFAMYQKTPDTLQKNAKKNPLCGTLEKMESYKAFLEHLKTGLPLVEFNAKSRSETTTATTTTTSGASSSQPQQPETTPLLAYLRAKKLEAKSSRQRDRDGRKREKDNKKKDKNDKKSKEKGKGKQKDDRKPKESSRRERRSKKKALERQARREVDRNGGPSGTGSGSGASSNAKTTVTTTSSSLTVKKTIATKPSAGSSSVSPQVIESNSSSGLKVTILKRTDSKPDPKSSSSNQPAALPPKPKSASSKPTVQKTTSSGLSISITKKSDGNGAPAPSSSNSKQSSASSSRPNSAGSGNSGNSGGNSSNQPGSTGKKGGGGRGYYSKRK